MWKNLINLFKKSNLFVQALDESYQMLDIDWVMYQASVKSLRHSDNAEVEVDIRAKDKQINAYEREVRKKIMTHLVVSGGADLSAGLALATVVIDIERIGDYTKNIHELARNHPSRLNAGSLENNLSHIETGVTRLFEDMITAFKTSDEHLARRVIDAYKEDLAAACDAITAGIVSGKTVDLSASDATTVALYARYLKRIASHSRSVVTSIVNPFHRIGYKEKNEDGFSS